MDIFLEELAFMGFNPPTIQHIASLMEWIVASGLQNTIIGFQSVDANGLGKEVLASFIHFLLNDNIGDLIRHIRKHGALDGVGHFIVAHINSYPRLRDEFKIQDFGHFFEHLDSDSNCG